MCSRKAALSPANFARVADYPHHVYSSEPEPHISKNSKTQLKIPLSNQIVFTIRRPSSSVGAAIYKISSLRHT